MRILMMIHRLADNSPYCFYVHEQAKALRAQGHDVTVISCVGTMPMMKALRPALYETDRRTPKEAVIDGVPVYFPRCLTLGNAGERWLGGWPMYRAARRCADGGVEPAAFARRAVSRGGADQPRRAKRRRSLAGAGKRGAKAARGDLRRHAQGAEMHG